MNSTLDILEYSAIYHEYYFNILNGGSKNFIGEIHSVFLPVLYRITPCNEINNKTTSYCKEIVRLKQ